MYRIRISSLEAVHTFEKIMEYSTKLDEALMRIGAQARLHSLETKQPHKLAPCSDSFLSGLLAISLTAKPSHAILQSSVQRHARHGKRQICRAAESGQSALTISMSMDDTSLLQANINPESQQARSSSVRATFHADEPIQTPQFV